MTALSLLLKSSGLVSDPPPLDGEGNRGNINPEPSHQSAFHVGWVKARFFSGPRPNDFSARREMLGRATLAPTYGSPIRIRRKAL